MNVKLSVTSSGGRLLSVNLPRGRCEIEFNPDADGETGQILADDGTVIGTARIVFGEPPPQIAGAIEHAEGRRGCRGCGDG